MATNLGLSGGVTTTPVTTPTNRSYSDKIGSIRHCYITHNFFPCTNFLYPPGGILKTVNKFIVIKSNTKNFDKSRLEQQKPEQKILTVYKALYGRYESKLKNDKNGFEAILSCVEFQTSLTRLAILNI